MDTDLILTLGLMLSVFSIPAMMSAYSDSRRLRAPALIVLIAGGMILFALTTRPGGYRLAEIPEVFYSVVARYLF